MWDFKEKNKIKIATKNKLESTKTDFTSQELYYQYRSATFKIMFDIDGMLRKDEFQANIFQSIYIFVGLIIQLLYYSNGLNKNK